MTERAHARLSASSSAMWLACPPSASLNAVEPDVTSEHAAEGTLGHDMTEASLLYWLGRIDDAEFAARMDAARAHEHYSDGLAIAVGVCVNKGMQLIEQARAEYPDALILIEARVDFSRWVPGGFGTSDLVIVTPEYIHAVDWKFGQGVWVDAAGNSQLRLYAAGAYDLYGPIFDPKEVRSTVVQPRVGNVDTERLTPAELLRWCEEVVRPAAALAHAGEGEFNPGAKQCRWCKVRGKCRARAEQNLAVAQDEFRQPVLMSDVEVAGLYPKLDELIMWAQDVQHHAHKRVLAGHEVAGLKAVEGRSVRFIDDKLSAILQLERAGIKQRDLLAPDPDVHERLLPLTALEKQHGAARIREILGELIVKPAGKVIVVPSTDKRIALDMATASPEEDFPDDTD